MQIHVCSISYLKIKLKLLRLSQRTNSVWNKARYFRILSRILLTISIKKYKIMFVLFRIILDFFYCILKLSALFYYGDKNYLSTKTFIKFLCKNLKTLLKTMKKQWWMWVLVNSDEQQICKPQLSEKLNFIVHLLQENTFCVYLYLFHQCKSSL